MRFSESIEFIKIGFIKNILNLIFLAVFSLFSLLSLSCSETKKQKNTDVFNFNEKVNFRPPPQGIKLTEQQVNEINSVFNAQRTLKLPPGEVIFKTNYTSEARTKELEDEFKQTDQQSSALLDEIKSECKILQPILTVTGKSAHDFFQTPQLNHINQSSTFNFSSGLFNTNCPSPVNSLARVDLVSLQTDSKTEDYRVKVAIDSSNKALLIPPKYQKWLNSRGLILNTTANGLAIKIDGFANLNLNFKLGGTFYSLNEKYEFDATVELLAKNINSNNIGQELSINLNLNMQKYLVNIVIYRELNEINSKPIKELVYINGHQVTAQTPLGIENLILILQKNITELVKNVT